MVQTSSQGINNTNSKKYSTRPLPSIARSVKGPKIFKTHDFFFYYRTHYFEPHFKKRRAHLHLGQYNQVTE